MVELWIWIRILILPIIGFANNINKLSLAFGDVWVLLIGQMVSGFCLQIMNCQYQLTLQGEFAWDMEIIGGWFIPTAA